MQRRVDDPHQDQLAIKFEQREIRLKRVTNRHSVNDVVEWISSFLHSSGIRANKILISSKMFKCLLFLLVGRTYHSHMVAKCLCYLHPHVSHPSKPQYSTPQPFLFQPKMWQWTVHSHTSTQQWRSLLRRQTLWDFHHKPNTQKCIIKFLNGDCRSN